MLGFVMFCNVVLCCLLMRYVAIFCAMFCYIALRFASVVVLFCAMLHYVLLFCAVPCYVVPCFAMLCHFTLCCGMLRYVVLHVCFEFFLLGYAMLCYVALSLSVALGRKQMKT